jgi:hypothetical protein
MKDNSVPSETMKAMILYCLHNKQKTKIVFTKKDGSERVMNCTLMESLLPARDDSSKETTHSPDVQPVWDLDVGGWRSFRWDSVISFDAVDREASNAI